MTNYSPIGLKPDVRNIIRLTNKEIELIRMMRKVEGGEYYSLIRNKWGYYLNEMDRLGLETKFIKRR